MFVIDRKGKIRRVHHVREMSAEPDYEAANVAARQAVTGLRQRGESTVRI